MPKRRDKRTPKMPLASDYKAASVDENHSKSEIILDSSMGREVERQIAAVKAISDMEVDHLLTALRLIRSYFWEDQLCVPVLQFFNKNLPNLEITRNSEDEHCQIRWKDGAGNLWPCNTDGRDTHAPISDHMAMAYPSFSAAIRSNGFKFSSKTVKSDLGVDDLWIGNFWCHESPNTVMLRTLGEHQTPGATSQRLSADMTSKRVRLPKHGEMLHSVNGSPLAVYEEDSMEPIHESEEV